MSLKDCVDQALAQGHITKEEADYLKARYDALASKILDPLRVKGQLTAEIAAEAAERQRKAGLAEKARKQVDADFETYRNAKGEKDFGEAFQRMHESTGSGTIRDAHFGIQMPLLAQIHKEIEAGLYEFRRGAIVGHLRRTNTLVGSHKTQARMANVVREMFGESTGDAAAAEFATVFSKAMDDLRVRFNDAGGNIGKLKKYGLPQYHDRAAMEAVGVTKWVDRLLVDGVLDPDRMIHPLTKLPMSKPELREFLTKAYHSILSDGWVDREAAGVPTGKGSLAGRHADHRYIHFKNADQWMKYAQEFGRPEPYEALMSHINMMVRDIAHMERFGPNPASLREYAKQRVIKEASTQGGAAMGEARKSIARADAMWEVMRGSDNIPVGSRLATGMAIGRNIVTSSALGSAAISAIGDVTTGTATRGFVGMGAAKAQPLRVLAETIRYMGTNNKRQAVRSELIMDQSIHILHTQSRMFGSMDTRSFSGYLADRVIALQGLSAITQSAKYAFGKDMQAMFADHTRVAFDKLPDMVRHTLERHGFDAASWDKVRVARLDEPKPGATFLRPNEIREMAATTKEQQLDHRALAERYSAMILRETAHAVVEGTYEGQAIMRGGTKPGTVVGELVRGFGQFKTFPATIILLQQRRIMQELMSGHKGLGAAYAGGLLITSTLLGLAVMALKDVKDGRDPRRWVDPESPIYIDPKTWGAALLQGGGLGIYGDFLFANANRHGGGLSQTVAGPMWDRLGAIKDLTVGNAQQLYEGKPTRFAAEATKVLRQNFPGNNLWYLNLAFNRILADQFQSMVDPEAHKSWHREVQQRRKNYNQSYWWEPGRPAPDRAPNLRAITGQQ